MAVVPDSNRIPFYIYSVHNFSNRIFIIRYSILLIGPWPAVILSYFVSIVNAHLCKKKRNNIAQDKQKDSTKLHKPPLCKGRWVLHSKTRRDCSYLLPICISHKMIVGQSLTRCAGAPFAQGSLMKFTLLRHLLLHKGGLQSPQKLIRYFVK